MTASIELTDAAGSRAFALAGELVTIGSAKENTIVVEARNVGRRHALIEPHRTGWSVKDLGTFGGTSINGKRIYAPQMLSDGDVITVGDATLVFKSTVGAGAATLTGFVRPAPPLEPDELVVLRALCRPRLLGDAFSEPPSPDELRRTLGMTEAALTKTLGSLYQKFGIFDEGDRRRIALANDAILRGAVTIADVTAD